MSFSKILIANRGEIACRVMRTARAMGYRTVAVYSDADASAPHVALADEAVRIGPPPAAESYLCIAALLDAARRTGADAVHPGYGFLSERADFARACAQAGLVFIGPPAEAVEAMGDKAGAKRRMRAAGVPCAPGYLGDDDSDERLSSEAVALGFPLLVKAVAGGGGRGMRLVQAPGELAGAIAGARREAQSSFGDGRLMLERLIEHSRHIEIQVFADAHGQAVHLGERDCTAQRRRQKVIEEAPSPIVSPAMRERMGADAVAAALAVGYVGAGTVEFIVDADLNHHFLEMNTRLQVEHPVTECITGFDLVEWQLRVAAGEPLSAWLPGGQASVRFEGHAIEARLYAEAPHEGFAPKTGRVLHWQPDAAVAAGRGSVRIDDGVAGGSEVTPWYDPMLAKLIVHGRTREDAIRRLVAAIDDSPLLGLPTNARFLRGLLQQGDFRAARMSTTRLDEWAAASHPLLAAPQPDDACWLAAAALAARGSLAPTQEAGLRGPGGAWQTLALACGEATRRWRVRLDGHAAVLDDGEKHHRVRLLPGEGPRWRFELDGVHRHITAVQAPDGAWHLAHEGAAFVFAEPAAGPDTRRAADPRRALAPVAGVVAQIAVEPGAVVVEGQPLLCVEAMKMEMWVHARAAGTVRALHVKLRDPVQSGALLLELEID
jgi:acetyl/propionyl-CoA carboxylase alpha subunit